MELVHWPTELPNPTASGFAFAHKQMGNTLTFSSGRSRVTRTRMLPLNDGSILGSFLLSCNVSFIFTLAEYAIFAAFYDDNWKRFSPQKDRLTFELNGLTWEGWPSTNPKRVLGSNGWVVSFEFQCFVPTAEFLFTFEENDNINPLWPTDEFDFLEGAAFIRSTRDVISLQNNLLISKSVVKDDNFVVGTISLNQAPLDRIFRFFTWWLVNCRAGALPFKLPATNLDLGKLNGVETPPNGFYKGKVLEAPQASFDSYFGTISVSVVLFPYVANANATTARSLISNTGNWLITDTGNRLIGVY